MILTGLFNINASRKLTFLFYFILFFLQDRILLQHNLNVYMCETPS